MTGLRASFTDSVGSFDSVEDMSDGYGLKIAGIVRLGGVLERTSEEFGLPESPNGPARRTSSQHSLKSRYEQSGETVGRRFSARRNSSTGNVRRHWQPTSTTRTRRRGNHRRKPETSAPGARVESKTRPPYKPRPKRKPEDDDFLDGIGIRHRRQRGDREWVFHSDTPPQPPCHRMGASPAPRARGGTDRPPRCR